MQTQHSKIVNKIEPAVKLLGQPFASFSQSLTGKFTELQATLAEPSKLEYYKWLDFDYLQTINQETKILAQQILAKNFTDVVIIGMGGSGINSLVLKNALFEFNAGKKSTLNFVVQNNLDPASFNARMQGLDYERTLFVLISKSGGTDEVRRNLAYLCDHVDLKTLAANTVILTEPKQDGKKNFLHKFADEVLAKTGIQIPCLENDPNIGGRFSMFSPVGMFTAELMGLNSDELLQGAEACLQDFIESHSDIFDLASLEIYLSRNGYNNRYSMVYSDSLEAVNKFRAQLKGESLNKTGIDSTIHVAGIGTVNHHSDLELLLKQNNGVLLDQVFFAEPSYDYVNGSSLECLQDLTGQSNHKALMDLHINPLYEYLIANKAMVIQTIIAKANEEHCAYLLMQDMLVTVVTAGLQDEIGSNTKLDLAVRQWEVERYKKSVTSK